MRHRRVMRLNEPLLYRFMEENNLTNFVLVGIDSSGEPHNYWRSTSQAASRSLRGFTQDWLDVQKELNAPKLFRGDAGC